MSTKQRQAAIDWFNQHFSRYDGILDTWPYDDETYRYYDDEGEKYLTEAQVRAISERYLKSRIKVVDELMGLLLAGMFLPRWVNQAREEITHTYFVMYLLGLGGLGQMTEADRVDLSQALQTQYHYLNRFADDMAEGNLSEDQIRYRASLYFQSSRQAFERARTIGARGLVLPAYPGDGSSECQANCKCWWRIIEFEDKWDAYWVRTAGESCPTCQVRSSEWAPYTVYK